MSRDTFDTRAQAAHNAAEGRRTVNASPEAKPVRARLSNSPVAWAAYAVLTVSVLALLMLFVDPLVGRWANGIYGTDAVERYRKTVGFLGQGHPYVLAFVVALAAAAILRSARYLRLGLVIVLTFAWAGGLCHLIKIAVHRPRPEIMWAPWWGDWGTNAVLIENRLHSFPSGDVTVAAGLAMIGVLLIGRGWPRYLLFAMPVLSAIARVTSARHYPSDCLAGALLGIATVVVLWRVVMRDPADQPAHDTDLAAGREPTAVGVSSPRGEEPIGSHPSLRK